MEPEDGEVRDGDTSRDEKRRLEGGNADRDAKRSRTEGEGGSAARGGSRDRSRDRSKERSSRDEKRSREDRDKGRDRSRERDRSKRDGDKGRDRSPLSRNLSSSRDRDRERSKERDREKDKKKKDKKDRGDRLDRIRDDKRDKPREREAGGKGGDRRDRGREDNDRGRDRERGGREDEGKWRGDREGDRRDKDRARERDRGSRPEDSKGRKDRDGDRRDDRRDGGRDGATRQEEDDDPMDQSVDFDLEEEEDKEEQLRLKREAILAKYKAKAAGGGGGGVGSKSPNVTPAADAAAPAAPSTTAHAAGTNGDATSDDRGDASAPKEEERVVQEGTPPTTNGDEGEDDMFSLTTPIRGYAPKEEDGFAEDERLGERNDMDRRMGVTNADNWDDAEGYFKTRPGEVIANRYKVMRDIGHGVYSTVVSASDEQQGNMEVAIKLIRSNETMYKAGRKEIDILKKLALEDAENKRHICRLLSHFEYKNHLCMVFVPAEMNLRKLLKTYGREVGISLPSIKVYAKQLLIGLHHMIKCQVVHGDIKLDNILITKDLKTVSICDFGTAVGLTTFCADWTVECTITPYMVSRYYRPPEIVLGLRYGHPMDLWSVGVCLFELYTGKFMFTGRNNNEMLKQFMDYKGAPPKKMLRHAQFKDQHFEEEKGNLMFKYLTKDIVTKQEIIQKINYDKPTKSIIEQLRKVRSSGDDLKKIKEFADLLEGIFILDPTKRISVSDALKHPFLN